MPVCNDVCTVSIPARLHGNGRDVVETLADDDCLYIWHEPINGEFNVLDELRVGNQSANSHLLNEGGAPDDVLFDTKTGGRLAKEIACVDITELRGLTLPHPNKVMKDKHGNVIPDFPGYMITFDAAHIPTGCMYPHCEIHVFEGGARKPKINNNQFCSIIRHSISRLMRKHRERMLALSSPAA